MNWIKNFVRPKIRNILGVKRETPENMWVKCPETGEMVFYRDLEANQFVIPGSGYHMRMAPDIRLKSMFDEGVYTPIEPARFVSGFNDEMCAYCEVENFASQLDSNKQWETRLKMDLVIYSDQGLELWSANKSDKNSSGLVVDRSRNRRHDFFVIQRFRLPKTLVIGRYIMKVTVIDQEVNRVAENSVPLEIVAQ